MPHSTCVHSLAVNQLETCLISCGLWTGTIFLNLVMDVSFKRISWHAKYMLLYTGIVWLMCLYLPHRLLSYSWHWAMTNLDGLPTMRATGSCTDRSVVSSSVHKLFASTVHNIHTLPQFISFANGRYSGKWPFDHPTLNCMSQDFSLLPQGE